MKRNIALDILKLILAFMVVGLHTGFLADISALGNYLTTQGIFRIAVPIFLLINGFYFYSILDKGRSAYWFKRVLYLYLFWMLFYSYFWFRPSDASFIEIVKIIHKLIIGHFHLWYLPAMLGAAALVILFKKLSLKLMIGIILVAFAGGVVIQYAGNYHMIDNQTIDKFFNYHWIHRNLFFFGFPFFFIGFLINKFSIQDRISLKLSVILSIIGFSLLICESYLNYIEPLRDGGFDNFISLLIVCPAVFLLFMKLDFQGSSKQLSFYATGVYFIHPIFMTIYSRFTDFDGTLLTFIVIISSIFASYFLIKINNKVKFIL